MEIKEEIAEIKEEIVEIDKIKEIGKIKEIEKMEQEQNEKLIEEIKEEPTKKLSGNLNYNTPWILQRADPYVYRHSDGWYYFTASVPAYDGIVLRLSLIHI